MSGDTFNFLDLKLKLDNNRCFQTSVYVKLTDGGIYTNFHSQVPMQYKKSLINSLVNRAIKFCSTRSDLNHELNRIKQVLSNSGYPQKMSDDIISRKMQARNPQTDEDQQSVDLYVQLYNVSNFRSDKNALQNIVNAHVKPTDINHRISVVAYYKPKKLSSMFSTRQSANDPDRSNVVYQFSCDQAACNASYIGYTTQKLSNRVKQHKRVTSSIHKHYTDENGPHKLPDSPAWTQLMKNFKILHSTIDVESLKITESLLIKQNKPDINVQFSESTCSLKLF